jgi:trans-2-enoyl-CoA reductase
MSAAAVTCVMQRRESICIARCSAPNLKTAVWYAQRRFALFAHGDSYLANNLNGYVYNTKEKAAREVKNLGAMMEHADM